MEKETKLPFFKVGELAEAKTFERGFRGAWFRCKFTEISKRKGDTGSVLEYYDFPDEKQKWTKLYQVSPLCARKGKVRRRELMIRPPYPPIYTEEQMPDVSMISEVTVIVNNSWKVGDLVDLWYDECHWSGKIIQLLGVDKVQVELKPPPLGEGSVYEGPYKDIRPSLDWSPESGWTVPTQDGATGTACFRLIKPINRGQEADQVTAGLSLSSPVTSNSLAFLGEVKSTSTAETKNQSLLNTDSKEVNNIEEKNSSPGCGPPNTDSVQTSAETTAAHEVANENDQKYEEVPSGGNTSLNSTRSDTIEAAILDLEECVNKIKWLKRILQDGISSSDAPTRSQSWEFVHPK